MAEKKTLLEYSPVGKRHFIVYDRIFNRAVHVFLNWTYCDYLKQWAKQQPTADEIDFGNNMGGWCSKVELADGQHVIVIGIPKYDWTLKDQGTLAHECVHAIMKMWDVQHIPLSPDNEEFLALSVGSLWEDIGRKIQSFHIKKVTTEAEDG